MGNKIETIDGNGRNLQLSYLDGGYFKRVQTKMDLNNAKTHYLYNTFNGDLVKEVRGADPNKASNPQKKTGQPQSLCFRNNTPGQASINLIML